jgi:predicted O-methyltransferase YrrM
MKDEGESGSRPSRVLLDELQRSGSRFHGWAEDVHVEWQLDERSLELLFESVGEGDRTLETGCGYSTVAFALAGCRHTAISPVQVEHDRVRAFCAEREISLDTVDLVLGYSQEVLPVLETEPLDFVLVDGSHAFPIPFIDWFYSALRLRVGGLMMIDDTNIKTGEILADFLASEAERWRQVERLPSLSVFEKVGEPVLSPFDWPGQPYCAKRRRVRGQGPTRFQALRWRLSIRTRLSRLLARSRDPE